MSSKKNPLKYFIYSVKKQCLACTYLSVYDYPCLCCLATYRVP